MEHFGDKVISFLKNATTKLEELQVQAALGKAELSDKMEDLKKDAKAQVHQLRSEVNSFMADNKDSIDQVKGKLEHLEVQLALAKADTMDELKEQKKNIEKAMRELKDFLRKA